MLLYAEITVANLVNIVVYHITEFVKPTDMLRLEHESDGISLSQHQ